ncbi:uncharacterized protein LOC120238253 [Hyaena hyaena]|uniref:uncharacterized protein LOC120238253 n=1 Tax=Hyaena hyaena TaxID=95912 RepID=UPI001924B71C|nr:uncharacterized protein LOC120238253 [Hyaena hyaena]
MAARRRRCLHRPVSPVCPALPPPPAGGAGAPIPDASVRTRTQHASGKKGTSASSGPAVGDTEEVGPRPQGQEPGVCRTPCESFWGTCGRVHAGRSPASSGPAVEGVGPSPQGQKQGLLRPRRGGAGVVKELHQHWQTRLRADPAAQTASVWKALTRPSLREEEESTVSISPLPSMLRVCIPLPSQALNSALGQGQLTLALHPVPPTLSALHRSSPPEDHHSV